MFALATVALVISSTVSGLVVPRTAPPAGWLTDVLEPYDRYHDRYIALSCQSKHNTTFFKECCHPLLATEQLSSRPEECNPDASKDDDAAADDDDDDIDDDDLPYCDDDDDDDDDDAVPTTATPTPAAAPVTTSHPAAPAPPVTSPAAAPKQAAPSPKPVAAPPAPAPAPAPAPIVAASNLNTGGFATYFYQNGVAGACGTVHGDNDMIAAIDADRYGNTGVRSGLCGKKVKLTNTKNNKSVQVTIADACPTCKNSNSIDLSVAAFKSIADLSEGLVPISWSFT